MLAVGQEVWLVAAGFPKNEDAEACKKKYADQIQKVPALRGAGVAEGKAKINFEVPQGEKQGEALVFGSFDTLIKLTDDLHKADSQVDGIIHRVERQVLELDPAAEFKVLTQRTAVPFEDYIKNWKWDEAKYPKGRTIQENLTLAMNIITKLDEEARNRTTGFNEMKTAKANLSKKEGVNLTAKDLIDVFTPDLVHSKGTAQDDFIMTETLTTVAVIIPRGGDAEFLKTYENFGPDVGCGVVPMSAKKFVGMDDKDGNTIWRVVMFKSAVESFKKNCREKRLVVRDFEYCEEAHKKLNAQRTKLHDDVSRHHGKVKEMYSAVWSDVFIIWMHIKAMRIFVEGVLRYGMPPKFASFILTPRGNDLINARKSLATILGSAAGSHPAMAGGAGDEQDDEEYFPYVSLSFVPFSITRGAA